MRIPGSGKYAALLVRDNAVGSDQGKPFLFVVGADKIVKQVPVEIGPLHAGLRVVKSGITKDDLVIVDGVALARNGVRVDVKSEIPMSLVTTPVSK